MIRGDNMNNFNSSSNDNYKDFSVILADYKDLLTVEDLTQIFATSKKTIYKELRAGKFGIPIQIGRAYLIPKIYIISRYFSGFSPDGNSHTTANGIATVGQI